VDGFYFIRINVIKAQKENEQKVQEPPGQLPHIKFAASPRIRKRQGKAGSRPGKLVPKVSSRQ
jgi:hypothetical protein